MHRNCIYQAKTLPTRIDGRKRVRADPKGQAGPIDSIPSPLESVSPGAGIFVLEGHQHLCRGPSLYDSASDTQPLCSTPLRTTPSNTTLESLRELSIQASIPPAKPTSISAPDTRASLPPTQPDQSLSSTATCPKFVESPSALALMTSQDIYLCTTIDLLAATEVRTIPSFSYFVQEARPPILASLDPVNWARMKIYVSNLGTQHKGVAAAILAVQSLYKAQANGLSTSRAMILYQAATGIFKKILVVEDGVQDFDTVLIIAFLLCLFEMLVLDDTGSVFEQSEGGALESRLQVWSLSDQHSPLSLRIVAWLQIIHAAARRGGNPGVLSNTISDLLSKFKGEIPPLSALAEDCNTDAPTSVHDLVSAPIFAFHLELQQVSTQVANLSHYHRSRTTSTDQQEVWSLMAHLKARIYLLRQTRPTLMKLSAADLRAQFSQPVAGPLITLIGICNATYYTEIVEVGRTLSDPPLASPEAREAMCHIRAIIEARAGAEDDWNVYTTTATTTTTSSGKLNPSYLRPLFLYAIESILQPSDTKWAVERLKEINDPICRSDFFASFASSLAHAQRSKGRRVTTKYFCYQTFGVSPPFL